MPSVYDIPQPKLWDGKDLKGIWEVTYKIDGVRALWIPGIGWRSRAGKPLYNIPEPYVGGTRMDCECFLGSLKDSVRAVRTQHLKPDTPQVRWEHLYRLFPLVDKRLYHGTLQDPTADQITQLMRWANGQGYEGLVVRSMNLPVGAPPVCYKVKPSDTYDVKVTGYVEGVGKHAGRLGALETTMGDVGTGFTDAEREALWSRRHDDLLALTIEVECMQLTPDGKFRHARFIRERFDK